MEIKSALKMRGLGEFLEFHRLDRFRFDLLQSSMKWEAVLRFLNAIALFDHV